MKTSAKQVVATLVAVLIVLVLGGAIALWTGAYNFAADVPHSRLVSSIIEFARERSVHVRLDGIAVPPLERPQLITAGAGHYAEMCAKCHAPPGAQPSGLSRGLYPSPPELTRKAVEPAEAFWIIKHGIKASGMPAWGKSEDDEEIWSLVAFLQKLPQMDEAAYRKMVEQSGSHAHGEGGEG